MFCLTYLLLPLIWFKSKLPAGVYAGGLVALHVVVLVVYCYKVAIRQLDPNWQSATVRALGLALSVWLLLIVSSWADSNVTSVAVFAGQLAVLCGVHTIILAIIMVRLDPRAQSRQEQRERLLSGQAVAVAVAADEEGPEQPSTPDDSEPSIRSPFH